MSVALFVAAQRTEYDVPHAVSFRALDLSESWLYKWLSRGPSPQELRRRRLDEAVKASFDDSGGTPGTYGSPRIWEDLVEDGWKVSVNTVAASMARQGLVARSPKRKRRSLTRPDKAAEPIPDLLGRDFTAECIDQKWCGDLTEIPTDEGKLYLATVEDLASRRLPGLPWVSITTPNWPVPLCVWLPLPVAGPLQGSSSTPIMPRLALSRGTFGLPVLVGIAD